jgi:hypothetical protein
MKLLGEEGESFTLRELNKQIKKMLTPRMRLEYVKLGGDTLNDKNVILAAIDKLGIYAKTNREIAESERKKKNGSEKRWLKRQKQRIAERSRELNPCKTHDGQHDWMAVRTILAQ